MYQLNIEITYFENITANLVLTYGLIYLSLTA